MTKEQKTLKKIYKICSDILGTGVYDSSHSTISQLAIDTLRETLNEKQLKSLFKELKS